MGVLWSKLVLRLRLLQGSVVSQLRRTLGLLTSFALLSLDEGIKWDYRVR